MLEVSTVAMNINSSQIIIGCVIVSLCLALAFIFKDTLKAFNDKHKIITCSNDIVKPVMHENGSGVTGDGVPFYEIEDAASNSMELAEVEETSADYGKAKAEHRKAA